MRASQFFISTLKEAPQDAQIISHQLMLRGGFIKKIASGIYAYTHLGLRVLRKIEHIIRDEMDQAGALECLMPMVQPAELWQETGRWQAFGEELLRFKDRHDSDFVLQPTSEEVVTAMARMDIQSYKQLPVNLYQIQTKFRDERRPRFGVMRGREFTMKDAYSFDADEAGMRASYQKMFDAYQRIFTRLGLAYRAVEADSGAIGGDGSCEFHVLAQAGEDTLVYSDASAYAANLEAASAQLPCVQSIDAQAMGLLPAMQKHDTPTQKTCEDVAQLLEISLQQTIKALVLMSDADKPTEKAQMHLVLLRGDHTLNEVKAAKHIPNMRLATEEEILQAFVCPPGFLGPIGMQNKVKIFADIEAAALTSFVCGANEAGYHISQVVWGRDAYFDETHDLRNVVEGDISPDGQGQLRFCRGIEVGHVFMLGSKYSQAMGANFIDQHGQSQPLVMGCYGIGVSRIMAAAIEQNHDARGIIWPASISPFTWVVCPIAYDKSPVVQNITDAIYAACQKLHIDVIVDDRPLRLGHMLADWELMGITHRLVISEKNIEKQQMEYQKRH